MDSGANERVGIHDVISRRERFRAGASTARMAPRLRGSTATVGGAVDGFGASFVAGATPGGGAVGAARVHGLL